MDGTKKIIIVEQEKNDWQVKWPPEDLLLFINWLTDKMYQIPQEYRNTATIEIDSCGGYEGEHSPTIEISYRRPKTNEEIQAEKEKQINQNQEEQARELLLLEHLKKKYESK